MRYLARLHTERHQRELFPGEVSLNAWSNSRCDSVVISGREVQLTPVFFAYWRFAAERQNIYFNRVHRKNSVTLTNDEILLEYKFTNSYRASDRTSQYLIRNVIYRDDLPKGHDEIFFRILLFKIFNKLETWELLERNVGEISLRKYLFDEYDSILLEKLLSRSPIYSPAYIIPSCDKVFGYKYKHQNHLRLLENLIEQKFPSRISKFASMEEAYDLLLSAPSFGPFLAYQFVTDLNYSEITNFSEQEFVMAGPGALDGIRKCFIGAEKIPAAEIIRFMMENQNYFFEQQSLIFKSLWGRPLQLIDCQNLFCEISKYARVAFPQIDGLSGRKRIKQRYAPGRSLPTPWFPPKWGINSKINI